MRSSVSAIGSKFYGTKVYLGPLWLAYALLAALQPSCSSSQQDEEKLATSEVEDSEAGSDSSEGSEANANGEDDPYDDNWNDIGSQPPPPPKPEKEEQQQAAEEPEQQVEEEPPLQNNKAEPVVNQVPVEEPPLDAEPAPAPVSASEPEPAPAPQEGPAAAPELPLITGAPLLRQDLAPQNAELIWVGYDYVERDGVVRVEMVTRGSPRFNIFQEYNQAKQPELVVRFFQTTLRDKVRRDIDASEFRSPVAFIRMRPDANESLVDVVITMRDEIRPRMWSKYGDVMLTFTIPDHYFGNSAIGQAPVASAEILPNTNLIPVFDQESDIPEGMKVARAFVTNPGEEAFKKAPVDGGEEVKPEAPPEKAPNGIPEDFGQPPANAVPPGNQGNIPLVSNGGASGGSNNLGAGNNLQAGDLGQGGAMNEDITLGDTDLSEGGGNESGEPPIGDDEVAPVTSEEDAEVNASEESEVDATENDESLDDVSDPEGDSSQELDKFDVSLPRRGTNGLAHATGFAFGLWAALSAMPSMPLAADAGEEAFAFFGVAQDDLQADSGGEGDAAGLGEDGGPTEGEPAPEGDADGDLGSNGAAGGNFPANGGTPSNGGLNNAGTGNGLPANQAGGNLGSGNLGSNGGANAAANATANAAANAAANAGNAQSVSNTAQPAEGEPPIDGAADLAGQEQEGSDSEEAAQGSSGGRPIKLDFRGAPLNEVIRALGDESGVNFVFPPDVGQKLVYVNLNGVPFNDALKAVLGANALGMVPIGPNVVRIDSLERIAADKDAEERRKKSDLKLRATKVLVYRLSYAKAADAAKMVNDLLAAAAKDDPRIAVQIDERTNSVVVYAPANDLTMAKTLLERVDLETPQVKIASRIVEVKKTFTDSFGISWNLPFNGDQGRGLGFGNLTFPNYALSRYSVDAGGTAPSTGNMAFRFGSANNSVSLDLALAMQEQRNTAEILQSSNILVEDNQESEIVAGSSDFFRVTLGGQSQLAEVTYNLTMKVKPHITADGSVQMRLTINSDSPSPPAASGGQAVASRNNRSVITSLLRRSGETAVIGGIYSNSNSKSASGVPILSSIPIIGALFRSSAQNEEKRELLVMVTPTIVSSRTGGGQSSGEGSLASAADAGAGATGVSNAGLEGGNANFEDNASAAGNQGAANSGGNSSLIDGNSGNTGQTANANNAQNTGNSEGNVEAENTGNNASGEEGEE